MTERPMSGSIHAMAGAPCSNATLRCPISYIPFIDIKYALYVLLLGVGPVHQLHALLVHREDYPAAERQPHQPRHGARPERQEALVPEDLGRAVEAVLVLRARRDGLHPRFDGVERLGDVSMNDPRSVDSHEEGVVCGGVKQGCHTR